MTNIYEGEAVSCSTMFAASSAGSAAPLQVAVERYPHPQFPVAGGYPMRTTAVAQDDFSQAGARYRFYDAQRQVSPRLHRIYSGSQHDAPADPSQSHVACTFFACLAK